jgi:hypothetical protein
MVTRRIVTEARHQTPVICYCFSVHSIDHILHVLDERVYRSRSSLMPIMCPRSTARRTRTKLSIRTESLREKADHRSVPQSASRVVDASCLFDKGQTCRKRPYHVGYGQTNDEQVPLERDVSCIGTILSISAHCAATLSRRVPPVPPVNVMPASRCQSPGGNFNPFQFGAGMAFIAAVVSFGANAIALPGIAFLA